MQDQKKSQLPDMVLVPLVAFDNYKNRLGYGKGFYDRYLYKLIKLNKKIRNYRWILFKHKKTIQF